MLPWTPGDCKVGATISRRWQTIKSFDDFVVFLLEDDRPVVRVVVEKPVHMHARDKHRDAIKSAIRKQCSCVATFVFDCSVLVEEQHKCSWDRRRVSRLPEGWRRIKDFCGDHCEILDGGRP